MFKEDAQDAAEDAADLPMAESTCQIPDQKDQVEPEKVRLFCASLALVGQN